MSSAGTRMGNVIEVYRLFCSLASPYVKRRLQLSFALAALIALLGAAAPLALKWIIDGVAAPVAGASTALLLLVALYVGSQWLNRVLGGLQSYVHALADRRMYRALNDQLFDHVIRLPLRFHLNRRTGAVSETLTNGLLGFQMIEQVFLNSLLPIALQLVTVSLILISLHQHVLLLLFLVALGCYGVAYAYGAIQSTRTARDVSVTQIDSRALLTDSILNYETVKFFTAERIIRERLDRSLYESEKTWVAYFRARSWNAVLVGTIFAAFLGVTMAYAVSAVSAGQMTVGTFVLVNAYLLQLVAPVEMIGSAAQTLSQGFAFVEKLLELFREKPEPPPSASIAPLSGPGRLEFKNVTVAYRADTAVLRNVSFVLPAGKTLGIVGASGAGKSTLVRLLVRLIEPDAGEILIDDKAVCDTEIASVRGSIAVVPQDTVLFDDTIAYNIAFGRVGCSPSEIENAARLAELHDFIAQLPEGYQTRVGERGVRLSGGEKQRISIARAALKRPRMFVFDEATSSLDSRTEQEILKNLRRLASNHTTLIIAHRLSTVVHSDKILVLHEGAVVEHGTHEALLAAGGRYAELWYAQSAKSEEGSAIHEES